jgi:hypothetical protein
MPMQNWLILEYESYRQSVGLLGRVISPSQGLYLYTEQHKHRPLPIHRTTQTQNKRTQTSMPRAGFEPTTPVFEWAKTAHALDRAATVIDYLLLSFPNIFLLSFHNETCTTVVTCLQIIGEGVCKLEWHRGNWLILTVTSCEVVINALLLWGKLYVSHKQTAFIMKRWKHIPPTMSG